MIKFFRKIRRQLLTENRFTKYLLYAIGEIVLVMIGILLALQVNIWNENRKGLERTEQLLVNVQKELAFNIKEANEVINGYRHKDSIIYKVLNEKATYNDYKTNMKYANLTLTSSGDFIIDDAYKNLINSSYKLSIEQDSMVNKLKELYGEYKKNEKWSFNMMDESVDKFLIKLGNEKEWYYRFRVFKEINDDAINYFLNNPFYLNNVANYSQNGIKFHCRQILIFRNKSIELYKEISKDLNLKKDTLIAKNIKNYEHYIGTYKADSLYTIIIKEEKKELFGYGYYIKQQDTINRWKDKVYPDSKTYFTYSLRFGQLNFDENNEVTGFVLSKGDERNELKKVK